MSARSPLSSPLAPVLARLRTASPYAVDAAVAALVLFAVSLQWLFPDEGDDPLSWRGWLLGAGTAVPLVWRRAAPFATACAVSVATPAQAVHHAPPPDLMYGGFVVLYTLAALARPWQRRVMLAGWLAGVAATISHKEDAEPFEYAFQLLSIVCAYALGSLTRTQRAYTAELEDRARHLERERAADTARATAQERARIARDMHDILAHAVSLMVVQAEAGPVVVRSDPARAEAAFDAIATAGRDAMTQLRRILGVLKEEEREPGPRRLPQPGLTALPGLVRRVGESAGLRVELRTTGEPGALPPDTEAAAYRIVQEALTNAARHAGPAKVRVRIDYGTRNTTDHTTDHTGDRMGELTIGVDDDGAADPDRPPVPGTGLTGMHERVSALGGTLRAAPRAEGGFSVRARLPLGDTV